MNVGIRTTVLDLVPVLGDPHATERDVVDAMRVPAGVSPEALLVDEMRALDGLFDAWDATSGMDTRELFLRNSACKRVLYVSAPIFLPDVIPVPQFVPTGVNTRVHVFEAPDVRDTVRLEAISSYAVGELRFRYALSIQYLRDSVGLGWQLIRPVVIVDPRLLAAARSGGSGAWAALERVLDHLRRIILLGTHDYVHATVLNWFPPLPDLPPAYAAICSEQAHPPEVDRWHEASQTALPAGFLPDVRTPGIASLELYSLLVHAGVIGWLWDRDPAIGRAVHGLIAGFEDALDELTATADLGDVVARQDAADYFTTVAGWFLVSALPLGSDRLAAVLDVVPEDRRQRLHERLSAVHEGMFDVVRYVDLERVPWGDRFVPLHDIAAEYAAALRWPGVRAHVGFLLAPRADGSTWLDELAGAAPGPERAELAAALDELRAGGERGLAALATGVLDRLRALASTGGPAGTTAAPQLAYARAVVASLVAIVEQLAAGRHSVLV